MNILITGPESTGKTTIATYIAEHVDGVFISEFAREYLEKHGPSYQEEDLLFFASESLDIYKNQKQDRINVFDTSILDIVVWSLYKYGRCDEQIIDQASGLPFDLILLTTPDVPWKEDPLRENENNRKALYDLFVLQLAKMNLTYEILLVDRQKREMQVKELIENVIKS